jgi:NADH:ubiquinone oxidoreductase subunit 2 (subunit N)
MSINIFTILLALFKNSTIFTTELTGLSRLHPLLAITLSLVLMSLAGIPPLAGFFTKYIVLVTAIENNYLILAIIAILGSVISGYYYLRIIKSIYFKDSDEYYYKLLAVPSSNSLSLTSSLIISVSFFIILTFLLYPTPLLTLTFEALLSTLL